MASTTFTDGVTPVVASWANDVNITTYYGDGVSVLRYIPVVEWPAIFNYTSTTNLYPYLQAAHSAESNLVYPDGLFNTASTLVVKTNGKVRAVNRRGTRLRITTAAPCLRTSPDSSDTVIENIRFMGVAGATGIDATPTGGSFPAYMIAPQIRNCDFDYDLAYGINADMIFAEIQYCTFGQQGAGAFPAAGAGTMCAIRSAVSTVFYPNHNVVSHCRFRAGGSTLPAVDLDGASAWTFQNCDFEFGGQVLRCTNGTASVKFLGSSWFESNVSSNGLFQFGAMNSPAIFEGATFLGNTCSEIFRITAAGMTDNARISVSYSTFVLSATGYVLLDQSAVSNTFPATDTFEWFDNSVSGGNALNKITTGSERRGGKSSPRLVVRGNTTTPGSIQLTSDPSTSVTFNGVGDVSITSAHPFASSTNNVTAIVTGLTAEIGRVLVVSTTQVRVQMKNAAGAMTDGPFSLVVYGS
jgi:hypothetical protein